MQTALVAGGAGFIGTHLCESLLTQGLKVICVDNFITSDRKNIDKFIKNPNYRFIEHNICEKLLLDEHVDYIFHLASPASPNKKSPRSYINHPIETLLVNSVGTYNLLEIAAKNNATFVYASSSEVYGDPSLSPQPETYFGNVNSVGPRSVYDEGKRFGEAITMAYVRSHKVNARIVRIFNTYGPFMQRDDGRVVSNFITQALANEQITIYGKGSQTRSFCYVSDMIQGLKKMMFSENANGEVINLGNPDERSIADLAAMIKQMLGSKSEIVFEELPTDDPKMRNPDIQKAKRILQWEPQIKLEDGLKKTIEFFKI